MRWRSWPALRAALPAGRWWRAREGALGLAAAALALGLALLAPAVTLDRPRPALVLVLDITQSMSVPDAPDPDHPATLRPRLDAARRALHAALARLPCGSRIGLAVFTEYRSYLLLAPLEVCEHLAELRGTLAAIDNRMAWTGNSEVAKGLHSAWTIAKALPGTPGMVFVTDGHEAPPLNPRFRPHFDDKPGEVGGLIVGVGGGLPQPIPKADPTGRPLGQWSADEVLQVDPRSQGRGASLGGEKLAGNDAGSVAEAAAVGATPGSEHLSALHEAYLQRLAGEQGLAYQRLGSVPALVRGLMAPALTRPVPAHLSLAPLALGVALVVLLWAQRGALVWLRRGALVWLRRGALGGLPRGAPRGSPRSAPGDLSPVRTRPPRR